MAAIVDVVYRSEWEDGFGARGWKLASTMGDPRVIATTAFVGERSDTSVFVHDIVDHRLCGLGIGGHRNEAVAVALHALRCGVSTHSSMSLMVEELMLGGDCGERLADFLPPDLPPDEMPRRPSNRMIMQTLIERHGGATVYERLMAHYHIIGSAGVLRALSCWSAQGLEVERRAAIGRCLQEVIQAAEDQVLTLGLDLAHGWIQVDNDQCSLAPDELATPHLSPVRVAVRHPERDAASEPLISIRRMGAGGGPLSPTP